jgi:hypothetical protein
LSKKGIGVGDDDDATVDGEGMMACPAMIRVSARIMSSPKFLLHISLRGGVLVFSAAVIECWISDPSARGESI